MAINRLSDSELVERLINGSQEAFTEIYIRYKDKLYRYCYLFFGDKVQSEDLIQDLFMLLWESRQLINPTLSLSSYLHTIARNRIFNIFKHRKITMLAAEKIASSIKRETEDPHNEIIYAEYQILLCSAIDKLPARRKEIFNMSRTENLSHKEIAEKLGISVNTVQEHISESLHFIKKHLKDMTDINMMICFFTFFQT